MNPRLARYVRSAFVLAAVLAGAAPSFAITWSVTDTSDNSTDPASLRYAIQNAVSGDTITFQLPNPSTITLTNGALTISNSLSVVGPGAAQLAISGNNASQVFYINSSGALTISGVTIENGVTGANGGGMFNLGFLTLTNCTVSHNSGGNFGSGIYNVGSLMLTNSSVSNNSGSANGGGIHNDFGGMLTLTNSTVSGNSAPNGFAGGINNFSTATLINSTVSGNSSYESGGGIGNSGGTLTIINSTISGNSTTESGGGIDNEGPLTLTNDTIVGNSAPSGQGGGIDNTSLLSTKSTLLANNGSGGNCESSYGTVTSAGYNLSDDGSCDGILTQTTDVNNTPTQLDPKGLQNNGGPTQTIALLPGSPAVDRIPVANCTDTNGNPVTTDQRGVSRPQGPACDVGAYELIQTVPFSSFDAYLAIATSRHPGFVLTSVFTLGSTSTSPQLANQAMTLQIANYTLSLPAGSFHRLWNASNAPYAYEGTVNGASLILGLVPLGKNEFQFDAAGSPVTLPGVKNPVTVSLSFGNNSGTAEVSALITQ